MKTEKRSNHVVPSSTGWAVRKTGSYRATRNFSNKSEATSYAIELSKEEQTEVYIHKKDGTIEYKNSYRISA